MDVYFSASSQEILKNKDAYLSVVEVVKKLGYTVLRSWLEASISLGKREKSNVPLSLDYPVIMNTILSADLVIFDITVASIGIGHQLTFSLDKAKPTLILFNNTKVNIEDVFIGGYDSPFMTLKGYKNLTELRDIVRSFLLENNQKQKIRFNLVIQKEQDKYLDWATFNYKMNKTDMIKKIIDIKIQEDELYQEYLINEKKNSK